MPRTPHPTRAGGPHHGRGGERGSKHPRGPTCCREGSLSRCPARGDTRPWPYCGARSEGANPRDRGRCLCHKRPSRGLLLRPQACVVRAACSERGLHGKCRATNNPPDVKIQSPRHPETQSGALRSLLCPLWFCVTVVSASRLSPGRLWRVGWPQAAPAHGHSVTRECLLRGQAQPLTWSVGRAGMQVQCPFWSDVLFCPGGQRCLETLLHESLPGAPRAELARARASLRASRQQDEAPDALPSHQASPPRTSRR